MVAKVEIRYAIDPDIKAGLDSLAKATGRKPSDVLEQALRLVLDPLPALIHAQQLLAAFQAQVVEVRDQVNVIADYCVDSHRTRAAKDNLLAARHSATSVNRGREA